MYKEISHKDRKYLIHDGQRMIAWNLYPFLALNLVHAFMWKENKLALRE